LLHAQRIGRCLAAVAVGALVVCGTAACGTSSDEVVARVAGVGTIDKGMVEHWMPIEARLMYQEVPHKAVPEGVVPDPPTYTACVAYLQDAPPLSTPSGPKPTVAEMRVGCAQRFRELKVITLNTLIGWEWTIGIAKQAGIRVSDAEAKHRLQEIRTSEFPKGREFDQYLKWTGQTEADMLFRSQVQLFEGKSQKVRIALEESSLPKGLSVKQRQKALEKLAEHLPTLKDWADKTSCSPGYVTSGCKQYTGSLAPGLPN
jgi:hypothetical protein